MSAFQFATPLALWALLALPLIWWLLRAIPPRPVEQAFPPLRILLQLKRPEETPDKTPWWLLLLRMLAVAGAIVGFAGPVLNPQHREPGTGPLLILLDGSWADARDWPRRIDRAAALIEDRAKLRIEASVAESNFDDAPDTIREVAAGLREQSAGCEKSRRALVTLYRMWNEVR